MKIILAKTAGFCFGVNNAVKITYNLLQDGKKKVYTLGPIIHNEQVIQDLEQKGVGIISRVNEASDDGIVIIRAHGVAPDIYKEIEGRHLEFVDATCPHIKKIHGLVREKKKEGYRIIIAGDANHPEIIGINGWCGNTALIANKPEDVENFPCIEEPCCLVAQTTFNRDKFESIYNKLKEKCKNVEKFDTICSATGSRQEEAARIAREADAMLVIGSKKSSNTQKLFEICKKYCEDTFFIESSGDLPPIDTRKVKTLGIIAGASTPERTIKEVLEKMDELNKQEGELSFEEAFESSMVSLRNGEIVKGKIIGYNSTEVFVDLGYKSDGIIPLEEFSDDPDFKPEQDVKIGEEIEVFVVKVNDGEGNVLLSKKRVDSIKSMDEIEEAYKHKTTLTGKVVEVTNGGVIASVKGVRVFIPASQLSEKYVKDLNVFLKQQVSIRIIEFNRNKKRIVGSQRVVLEEIRQKAEDEFWNNIEVGKKYKGVVKSLTDFGAFVDIGGVDGLVHISEMSWTRIKHPSEVMKVGDQVEVTVLEFDREKKKISLGYRKAEDNPWYKADEKYKVGDIVKGKVVRLVPFGAFIELEKGVDGLVHISQISNVRLAKPGDVLQPGQEVEAKVIEVDTESKRISLSIKEVKPIDPVSSKEENHEADTQKSENDVNNTEKAIKEEIPKEHVEPLHNTIGDILNLAENKEN